MILECNFIHQGVLYPLEKPLPLEVAKEVPKHIRDEYEIKPGAKRERSSAGYAVGSFVTGVSYPIGPDGVPVHTEQTRAAEKRQLKAQAELRDLEWERFHQSTAFESEKTAAAHSLMEGASTETTQPVDSLQEFVKRGANYVRIERASPRPGEFIYTCESDGSFLAVGKVQEEEQEGGE